MDQTQQKLTSWVGGLKVRSNRPLADHPAVKGAGCDLDLVFLSDPAAPQADGAGVDEGLRWLSVPNAGSVTARIRLDGRVAWIQESNSVSIDPSAEARRVVPFAAALQGRIVLHAGAVAANRQVHALIGESGVGKTTLVTELVRSGLEVVADDLLPCEVSEDRVVVPDRVAKDDSDLTLRGIYFLERQHGLSKPEWAVLSPVEVVQELLRHGFGEMELPRIWALQFEAYGRIAEICKGYRLSMPEGMELLEAAVRHLAAHLLGAEPSNDPSGLQP